MLEDFDRISVRVTLSGLMGGLAGVGTAMYRGHPLARTVGLTALSCAMVGSACFTSERVFALALRDSEKELGRSPFLIMTHACGGVVGGSVLGYLYIRKPMHGVVFFMPLMTAIGFAESLFQDLVEEQQQYPLRKQSR
jgi:hypothetical protein